METALALVIVLLACLVVYFKDRADSQYKRATDLDAQLKASQLVRSQMVESHALEVARLREAVAMEVQRAKTLEEDLAKAAPGARLRDLGRLPTP